VSTRGAWVVALAALALALVAARAYAPIAVQRYVNRALDSANGYEGHIGDVDLNLWRGAYEIEDVQILKSGGKAPVPLLSAPLVDLSIEWRALLDGALVGEMWLESPQLNFVAGPKSERQSGVEADWRDVVRSLMPVRINRVTARHGSVHFRSFHTDPPVDVYLHDVQLVVRNLTNSADLSEDMVARATFAGVPMQAGRLKGNLAIDPYAKLPTFDLDCQLTGVALTNFNDLFRAYAGVDVQRGRLRLYAELRAKNGSFHGYVKPFFENVDVLTQEELEDQGFFSSLWEAVVGGAAEVFEDQSEDRVATRIPIAGTVASPDIGFFRTLANVLRNAFMDAFVPALEHSVGEE
jgi:hypothetical protein